VLDRLLVADVFGHKLAFWVDVVESEGYCRNQDRLKTLKKRRDGDAI